MRRSLLGAAEFQNMKTNIRCAEERWRRTNMLVNHTDEAISQSEMSLACLNFMT